MNQGKCPDELLFVQYIDQQLSPVERGQMNEHLRDCDDCRELVTLFNRINEDLYQLPSLNNEEIERITETVLTLIEQDYSSEQKQ